MKKKLWIPLCVGFLLQLGCGGNKETASNSPSQNSQASAQNSGATKTAGSSKIQYPSDPKEVVRLFFDSMRQGNGEQLSALLSTAAREEIKRKDLKIDPLGSPMASFQIGEAAEQADGMLISSVWSEPEQNGLPAADLEVVWELRKEAAGWRICGMAVDPQTGEEVQVVNFEHLEPETPEQRVASLPNTLPPTGSQLPTNNATVAPSGAPTNAIPASFNQGSLGNTPTSTQYSQPGNAFPSNAQPGLQSGAPNAGQPGIGLPPASLPSTSGLPPTNGLPPANSLPTGNGLPAAGNTPPNNQFRR